jgi:long-chain acyl-CoA synthetase
MKLILVPDFSPKNLVKTIKKYKPNFLCAVPSLFETLAKSSKLGKKDLACIKCAVCGGDFMSASLKRLVDKCLEDHGSIAEVRVGYGLSEASAATCLTPSGRYKAGSIGIPFPDTYYKIVKIGTHDEAKENEDGEICISGPTVMMGYVNNEEETFETLRVHDDGMLWLHTGDVGCMDKEGYVFFKQRLKRVIISNGYNIYPTYVEEVINSHPSVLTSTVIGIPHPKKRQVAKAFIVLKDGIKPSKELLKEIKNYLSLNLSSYSLPSEYEFRESLPKTLVGKVAYTKLEENTQDKK